MSRKHLKKGLEKKTKETSKGQWIKPLKNNIDGVSGGSIFVKENLIEKSGKVVVDDGSCENSRE